ncbi:endonuclease I [Hahella sp. CCB-MM4]|uniref:endonuclease n=1 Tax=Hahella sp. (strain CCB-MM4) TaxID=1926491 RepID=UPI000B9C5308|nr:endonuclease [Hahella sp. CCB-MM4]OZG70688.1 endonuclease I [Hahella sp. CCB-MM4]
MKEICTVLAYLLAFTCSAAIAQTKLDDPKETLKNEFWGKLYANGGETLICKKKFSKKSILVTESYIYSTLWMRDNLECGTPRQCREHDATYRKLTSDLHNIYPEDARFELERRAGKFEELDASVPISECNIRRVFGVIDPPDDVKGDIARSLLYMHVTYDLPLYGDLNQLKRWNRIDPPSPAEIERNNQIREIQGNDNPFIVNPEAADDIKLLH